MSIEIRAEGLDCAIASMESVLDSLGGKNAEKCVAKALNKSLSQGRKIAAMEARKAYTAPVKKLFDNVKITRARASSLYGELLLTGTRGVSLFNFKPSVRDASTRPRGGVSSQVRRKGSRYVHSDPDFMPHSKPFVMRKAQGGFGIFVRKKGSSFNEKRDDGSTDWNKVKMLFGASPIQALQRKDVQEKVAEAIEEAFEPTLQEEIDRMLQASLGK